MLHHTLYDVYDTFSDIVRRKQWVTNKITLSAMFKVYLVLFTQTNTRKVGFKSSVFTLRTVTKSFTLPARKTVSNALCHVITAVEWS